MLKNSELSLQEKWLEAARVRIALKRSLPEQRAMFAKLGGTGGGGWKIIRST